MNGSQEVSGHQLQVCEGRREGRRGLPRPTPRGDFHGHAQRSLTGPGEQLRRRPIRVRKAEREGRVLVP